MQQLAAATSHRTAETADRALWTGQVTCNSWPSSEVQTLFSATDLPDTLSQTDGGGKLQLGVKFWTEVPGTISAFRYFKATDEPAAMRLGAIWPWNADRGAPAPNVTTGLFDDSACAGGQWVRVPLTQPFSPEPHVQYAIAVDSITFYAQTAAYWPYPTETHKRDITVFGGVFGTTSGSFPGDFRNYAKNYWIDCKSGHFHCVPRYLLIVLRLPCPACVS